MIPYIWLEEARQRIAPHINRTPLTYDSRLDIHLKWENHQVTGSFKARGALNKILSLQDWELEQGLVTASAGNHGQGVALAAGLKHAPATIFASEHASPNKVQAMRQLGADVKLVAGGYAEAENAGITYARQTGSTWVSPYNDGLVIAGQGTVALEILDEISADSTLTWVVPAGGGGLVSGIGCALPAVKPKHSLVAVQSEASPFLHAIFHRGTQADVIELDSLADGLSGPVEAGSVTVPMVMNYVSDFILVSENEISQAIKYTWDVYHERIEGSAAVTLAAVLSGQVPGRPAVLVLTGGNINPVLIDQIINADSPV